MGKKDHGISPRWPKKVSMKKPVTPKETTPFTRGKEERRGSVGERGNLSKKEGKSLTVMSEVKNVPAGTKKKKRTNKKSLVKP